MALTLDIALEENVLLVRGETDLPDGTLLAYDVHHETFLPVADTTLSRQGLVPVDAGRYATEADVTGWPAGTVVVDVVFRVDLADGTQPDEVRNRFGEDGARLGGDNVTRRAGQRQVAVRAEAYR